MSPDRSVEKCRQGKITSCHRALPQRHADNRRRRHHRAGQHRGRTTVRLPPRRVDWATEQSAEERASPADMSLQADILADWLSVLDRPAINGVLIWRWFTDSDAGGWTIPILPSRAGRGSAFRPAHGHGGANRIRRSSPRLDCSRPASSRTGSCVATTWSADSHIDRGRRRSARRGPAAREAGRRTAGQICA